MTSITRYLAIVLLSTDIFRAVGERELAWTKQYAKPRLPHERLYRETYNFRRVSGVFRLRAISIISLMT